MKATIETRTQSIPADAPVVEGAQRERRSVRRSPRAMTAAVLIAAVSATAVVGTMVDESGTQQTEAESSSPPTTAREQAAEPTSAGSSLDRDVLIVEVGRLDAGTAGGEESPSTSPSVSNPTASSTTGADGAVESSIDTDPAVEAGQSSVTTGSSSDGTGPTSTATTPAPPVTSRPAPTSMSTSTESGSGVAWEEHFNGLDTGRWRLEHSTYGDGNGERQCYQPDNVRVANGRLILTARAETATCPNGSTRSVTSGMVRSRGLTFSPGQAIEFRVKLTPPDPSNQAGLWPAVWASSWAGSWPRGGELDFLEVMTAEDPRRAVFSMHYADRSGGHELQNKAVPLTGYFSDGWHTIRFDYGRNGNLVWFLDGSKVFSVSAAGTAQGYPAPFDQTINEIKLNLAIGGSPGPLATGVLGSTGATFEIDYIKVFDL